MELLYVKEHYVCENYVSDFNIGFSHYSFQKGKELQIPKDLNSRFFFLLKGMVEVSSNELGNLRVPANEMLFMPAGITYTCTILDFTEIVILCFDNEISLCEKLSLEQLKTYCSNDTKAIDTIEIRHPMMLVLDSILFYLNHQIRCKHLFEGKQKEIFLILRTFYTKEEAAHLLAPLISSDFQFRNFILCNYLKVKNIEELADGCNMSKRTFLRKFKECFGDTPYNWMLKQKSLHIRNRLLDANIPISTIINEFGFNTAAHFTYYCKKYLGKSPSCFRHKLHDKEE